MKAFTAPKAIMAVVVCGSSNNHGHGRIVSVSELLLQVTPFAGGLATGFTFLFWKREIMGKIRLNKNTRT
jgi:hypothetical protein